MDSSWGKQRIDPNVRKKAWRNEILWEIRILKSFDIFLGIEKAVHAWAGLWIDSGKPWGGLELFSLASLDTLKAQERNGKAERDAHCLTQCWRVLWCTHGASLLKQGFSVPRHVRLSPSSNLLTTKLMNRDSSGHERQRIKPLQT